MEIIRLSLSRKMLEGFDYQSILVRMTRDKEVGDERFMRTNGERMVVHGGKANFPKRLKKK